MPDNPIKQQAEQALIDSRFDFIAKYHAVTDLRRIVRYNQKRHDLDRKTLAAVEALLRSDRFIKVRQSYFLFREAAKIAKDMIVSSNGVGLGRDALELLQKLLQDVGGSAHRGVAEALGSLPITIKGPKLSLHGGGDTPSTSWSQLIRSNALDLSGDLRYIGRSLVAQTSVPGRILVVKLAKRDDRADGLGREIRWMEQLGGTEADNGRRFHIPSPLKVHGKAVFRLDHLPLETPTNLERHPHRLAIAFATQTDYFVYPNQQGLTGETALEILGRNAYLMGSLAARGILHEAPIPLFHNRTQRLRRDDQGRYQWFRSGRLDQWLDSCAFPNLGLSGLRDFEHLISFTGESPALYRHLGTHFLSLLLIAGSHFRVRDTSRRGLDEDGRPVDAQDLFDAGLLRMMTVAIFENYYEGFCDTPPNMDMPFDVDRLVRRMIEEMGVDRHMTELLRRADQKQMTGDQFRMFLREKGYEEDSVGKMQPGQKDILIQSGPHLGDFNSQISLPELIEAVAAMSAVCIAGRYIN